MPPVVASPVPGCPQMRCTITHSMHVVARLIEADGALCAAPRRLQVAAVATAIVAVFASWLLFVPKAYIDFSTLPLIDSISQPVGYGTDTLADMYEARVVLN